MASIKESTEKAIAFAQSALGPERIRGIRLEEVESSTVDHEDVWLITLSMIAPPEPPGVGGIANIGALFDKDKREYKIFTVVKGNGEVTSMKIRELANA